MANNRPLDKTKKSNIKCEHCASFNREKEVVVSPGNTANWCNKLGCPKNYWNRCKGFEWEEDSK